MLLSGKGGSGVGGAKGGGISSRKVRDDVQRRREKVERKENGTNSRNAWEEKGERMVQSSM